MAHARTQIRQRIIQTLTGLPTTKKRVFGSRVYPMDIDSLPGIAVYTLSEQSEPATMNSRLVRMLDVAVEIYAKLADDIDGLIDKIAVEVESAIAADTDILDMVKWINLTETKIEISGDGEKPVAVATLTFSVRYETLENNPQDFV